MRASCSFSDLRGSISGFSNSTPAPIHSAPSPPSVDILPALHLVKFLTMPVREIAEAEVNTTIGAMAPRLVFLLEERRVPRMVIAAVGGDDVLTVAQFSKTGRNEEGFYSWLEEDLGIKVSDQGGRSLQARMADAWEAAKRHKEEAETMAGRTRAMGLQPELQKGDQVALRKQYRELAGTLDDEEYPSYSYLNNRLEELEEGELVAETLDEVTTRQMELRQPADHLGGIAWNKKGEPILKKGKVRGSPPPRTRKVTGGHIAS